MGEVGKRAGPARRVYKGRSFFLLKSSSLAAVWRTDCWDLGWDQEVRKEGREVRGDGVYSRWGRWMDWALGGC